MKNLIFFFCIFLSFPLIAQETFIKIFDYDAPGLAFNNSILVEDTIIINGGYLNEDYSQWGILFSKIDTLGNVLEEKIYFDSLGSNLVLEDTYEIIRTSDGGYALTGIVFNRGSIFLLKLNVNGNLEFFKEYVDEDVGTERPKKVLEIPEGYLIGGTKQQLDDYKNDVFIMKTDFEGNKIWEINYGDFDLYNGIGSIVPRGNDEYFIPVSTSTSATTGSNPNLPFVTEAWIQQKFITINGEGDIISERIDEPFPWLSEEETIKSSIIETDEGDWVYKSATWGIEYVPPDPEPFFRIQTRIIKIDSTFENEIWNTPLGSTVGRNGFSELISTPDNGWLAVGKHRVEAQNPNQKNYQAGWLAKVDDYGNFLWSRTDTAFYAAHIDEERIEHYLNSVVTLPSGSIIATGRINNYEEDPSRSYGWMIKLDKDGCLEPGCHPNLTGVNLTQHIDSFEVYPNPTSDRINIEGEGKFGTEVFNSSGQKVISLEQHDTSGYLDLSALPSGIYYVNILLEGHFILVKKVVRR